MELETLIFHVMNIFKLPQLPLIIFYYTHIKLQSINLMTIIYFCYCDRNVFVWALETENKKSNLFHSPLNGLLYY